jgi:L-lactate dehydrogenase complex protein LldE
VQLLVTCIIDTLYPETAEAVVRVLQRAGIKVNFPRGQTCCGQPAFNAGMRPEARKMAEHTIRIMEDYPGDIVIPSGSCAGMIRHGYAELFVDHPDWLRRAKALSDRTYEFTEFLVDVLSIKSFGTEHRGKLTYHSSCHLLRDMGIDEHPKRLLENVQGAELVLLPESEECCGFGGLFSIEHPEISKAMLDRKIENFIASGASIMVACDAGCLAHISGGIHRRKLPLHTLHIAEVLDDRQ